MKAKNLRAGEIFSVTITGQVVEVGPIADGRWVRVKLRLQNQAATGLVFSDRAVIEFSCRHNCEFCTQSENDDEE